MIFLTLGTHQPFDRLVRAVDSWCEAAGSQEIFGQIPSPGATGYWPKHFAWVERLHPQAYRDHFLRAALVVAHAGMGSIITAMSLSRPILVMPRRAHLGEQRNDHQLATVRRFAGKPGIFVALDEDDLRAEMDRLARVPPDIEPGPLSPFADDGLTRALRAAIIGGAFPGPGQLPSGVPSPDDRTWLG